MARAAFLTYLATYGPGPETGNGDARVFYEQMINQLTDGPKGQQRRLETMLQLNENTLQGTTPGKRSFPIEERDCRPCLPAEDFCFFPGEDVMMLSQYEKWNDGVFANDLTWYRQDKEHFCVHDAVKPHCKTAKRLKQHLRKAQQKEVEGMMCKQRKGENVISRYRLKDRKCYGK